MPELAYAIRISWRAFTGRPLRILAEYLDPFTACAGKKWLSTIGECSPAWLRAPDLRIGACSDRMKRSVRAQKKKNNPRQPPGLRAAPNPAWRCPAITKKARRTRPDTAHLGWVHWTLR